MQVEEIGIDEQSNYMSVASSAKENKAPISQLQRLQNAL